MGGSISYVPSWAQGDKESKSSRPQPKDNLVSTTTTTTTTTTTANKGAFDVGALEKEEEEERRKRAIYERCVNSMFEAYVSNSTICVSPECKSKIYRKKTTLVLHVVPIIRLVPVILKDPKSGEPQMYMSVPNMYFEVENGQNIFSTANFTSSFSESYRSETVSGTTTNASNTFETSFGLAHNNEDGQGREELSIGATGYIGETIYISPITIKTLQINTHLPIPLTIRIANVLFTKNEIDNNLKKKQSRMEELQNWRSSHPISGGTLRYASTEVFRGDDFNNRRFSSSQFKEQNKRQSKYNNKQKNEKENEDHKDNEESGEENDGGNNGEEEEEEEERGNHQGSFLSTTYKCSSGDHGADLRYINRMQEHHSGILAAKKQVSSGNYGGDLLSENRNIVIWVPGAKVQPSNTHDPLHIFSPSYLSTGFSPAEKSVVFRSTVDVKTVADNYATPYEYLSSRLERIKVDEDSNVEGLHTFTDPELIQLQHTTTHLEVLNKVKSFMDSHDFFFASDFMMNMYSTLLRKRQSEASQIKQTATTTTSNPSGSPEKRAIRVGCFKNGALNLNLVGKKTTLPLENLDSNKKEEIPIFAIPTSTCNWIRGQLQSKLHQKLRFSDFSNPIIEVNVDDEDMKRYLKELEYTINQAMLQQQRNQSVLDPSHLNEREECLKPLIIYLEMECLEIRHPQTLF